MKHHPPRTEIMAQLSDELSQLDEDPELDAEDRAEVRRMLSGLLELLASLDGRDEQVSPDALQEVARAYLVGWRDAVGPPTSRRALWERLAASGIVVD